MDQDDFLGSAGENSAIDAEFLAAIASSNKVNSSQPTRPRSHSGGHGLPSKIRRRNRLITSCLECRRRKLKCDKSHPCGNCMKFSRDCVYLAPSLDPQAQMKLAEIKEKMGTLERTLEKDVARRPSDHLGESLGLQFSDEDSDEDPDEENKLEPTPLAFMDAAYYEDGDDDMMDLGVQIGKMRLTERLGGFVRPKIAFEVSEIHHQPNMSLIRNSDGSLFQIAPHCKRKLSWGQPTASTCWPPLCRSIRRLYRTII
jgi:hypothetical protein